MPWNTPRRPRNGLFDFVAPFWDALIGRWGLRRVIDALAFDAPARVLDLAGGTGRLAAQLSREGHAICVADLSAAMARRAARKGLPSIRARAEQLPFSDASFERLVILDAFHHMADLSAVTTELARVLAPDGRVVLFEPDPQSFIGTWIARLERWAGMSSLLLDASSFERLLATAGLSCQVERGHFHLLITARKIADQKSSTKAPR